MFTSILILNSLTFSGLGLFFIAAGSSLALALKIPSESEFKDRMNELSVRIAYRCILGGGISLFIALLTLIVAGFWWGFSQLLADFTPGSLALFSLALGPAPLLITALASALASFLGCSLDASGTRNCNFLSIDIGPLLHSLFMTYWLVFITAGLAFIGIFSSGIWALINLF